ncbi:MAG TPA: 7-carboxy-7-deazaguanine synthase QueE [Bacteroidales bacterium]|nr:7-carboxy-7-deazaguanine synthase QueE [Bacteroidales bacterium]
MQIKNENGEKLPLVEEFYTLQGEGFHAGKAAYFIRIGGCDIGCSWCDSRFAWRSGIHPSVSVDVIVRHAVESGTDSVVVTGGEPLMWNLDLLCKGLKDNGINTYIETSGAYPLSGTWDWICLSPKKNMPPLDYICEIADELKVIIQDAGDFEWAEKYRTKVNDNCKLYLQPEWSRFKQITPEIVDYIKKNYFWRVSLQIHKFMHIP